jgi:hypothetical protein
MAAYIAIGTLFIAGKFVFGEERWRAFLPQTLVASLLGVLFILSLIAVNSTRGPRRRRRNLTAVVAAYDDIRSIGPLIDALSMGDAQSREIAIDALIGLLPLLKASDSALLNGAQRAKLRFFLGVPVDKTLHKDLNALFRPASNRAIEFRIAILRALEQVGDIKALPIVQNLANGKPKTDGEGRIHEAAKACLPAIQMRCDEVRTSQTLMRPSDPGHVDDETLLRPLSGPPAANPEELLRPADPR